MPIPKMFHRNSSTVLQWWFLIILILRASIWIPKQDYSKANERNLITINHLKAWQRKFRRTILASLFDFRFSIRQKLANTNKNRIESQFVLFYLRSTKIRFQLDCESNLLAAKIEYWTAIKVFSFYSIRLIKQIFVPFIMRNERHYSLKIAFSVIRLGSMLFSP